MRFRLPVLRYKPLSHLCINTSHPCRCVTFLHRLIIGALRFSPAACNIQTRSGNSAILSRVPCLPTKDHMTGEDSNDEEEEGSGGLISMGCSRRICRAIGKYFLNRRTFLSAMPHVSCQSCQSCIASSLTSPICTQPCKEENHHHFYHRACSTNLGIRFGELVYFRTSCHTVSGYLFLEYAQFFLRCP